MNSESELIKALSQLVVTEDEPLEYRLHYNESGDIFMCTMQQHPDNKNYVVVDKPTYDSYYKYRVVNQLLELINHDNGVKVQLVKSTTGYRVVKNNVALLLEKDETYSDIGHYDKRSY